MTHPSPLAVDIIWDRFECTFMQPEDRDRNVAIEKVKKAIEHRFLHHDAEAIHSFAEGQLENITTLQKQYPYLDWNKEVQYFLNLQESN